MNGKCHICHKNSKLTFEHIPPYHVGNKKGFAREVEETGEIKRHGSVKRTRKGYGINAICETCRKITEPYTTEYIKAHKAIDSHINNIGGFDNIIIGNQIEIPLKINPLYFIKYIAQSILCLNNIKFGEKHTYLREFVLEPSSQIGLGPFRFFMYLTNVKFFYAAPEVIQTWHIPTLYTDWSNENIKVLEEDDDGLLPYIRKTTNKTPSKQELLEWERLHYKVFESNGLKTSQWSYAPIGFIFSPLFPYGMTNCYIYDFCDITQCASANNMDSDIILSLLFKPYGICPFPDPSLLKGRKVTKLTGFNNPLFNTDFAGISFFPFDNDLILMSPKYYIQTPINNVDLKSIKITYTEFLWDATLS